MAVNLEERYKASMVLSGVGDAIGFRNTTWEFNYDGANIHAELHQLGGLAQIAVDSMSHLIFSHLKTGSAEPLLNYTKSSVFLITFTIFSSFSTTMFSIILLLGRPER